MPWRTKNAEKYSGGSASILSFPQYSLRFILRYETLEKYRTVEQRACICPPSSQSISLNSAYDPVLDQTGQCVFFAYHTALDLCSFIKVRCADHISYLYKGIVAKVVDVPGSVRDPDQNIPDQFFRFLIFRFAQILIFPFRPVSLIFGCIRRIIERSGFIILVRQLLWICLSDESGTTGSRGSGFCNSGLFLLYGSSADSFADQISSGAV